MTEQELDTIIKKIAKPTKWIIFKSWWTFFWNCTILRKTRMKFYSVVFVEIHGFLKEENLNIIHLIKYLKKMMSVKNLDTYMDF